MWHVWDNIEALVRVSRWAPYVFIAIGFVIAVAGQFVRATVDDRIEILRADAADRRRATAPMVEAQLALGPDGDLRTVVEVANDIPILANWVIVNSADAVLTGVMLKETEFHPTDTLRTWTRVERVPLDQAPDGVIELRFRYASVYSAERGNPVNLRGEIRKRYHFEAGKLTPLE